MRREVSIHEVAQDGLHAELVHLIEYLRDLGHERCQVVFGWHWGMNYPPEAPWKAIDVPLSDLVTEVQKPEDAGYGEFGGDDVIITVPMHRPREFGQACSGHPIRLKFTPPSQVAADFSAALVGGGPRGRGEGLPAGLLRRL